MMGKEESYEGRVEKHLLPLIEEHDFELVDVECVKGASTQYLRAYIDKEGGIAMDDCEVVNRALSSWLNKEDFIDDNYILEASSPGLDRPLKKEKDLVRSIGKDVGVGLCRQPNEQKEFTGAFSTYDENIVTLTMEDGNQVVFEKVDIVLIWFALGFQLDHSHVETQIRG